MDYFSPEFIFFCGIIVGAALVISTQMAIRELFHH